MTALAARDAKGMLRFLAVAEKLAGEQPFTPSVLEELGKLVEADCVWYCEQDRVRQRIRSSVVRSGDGWAGQPLVSYWEIADEHPVCRTQNRVFRALKVSDFLALRELKRSRLYALWFRPTGVDRELSVPIPSPPWHTKTFGFHRGPGADFTERDRLVLSLLKPHLGRLWCAAETRRRLTAALVLLELEAEEQGRGVIALRPGGGIDIVSPAARRLVHEYFGAPTGAALPAELADWLETEASTLRRQRGGLRLTITRSDNMLLLEETRDELGLTARERQILAWVARGKTNPQIAELLWISPTTVRKHLENVYAKLGVRTRTAAAACFLAALAAKEQREPAIRR